MTDEEILNRIEAWFDLEDHSVRENKFVYVSSEAITRRMNSIFGIHWSTKCVSYKVEDTIDGKYQATAHVDMTAIPDGYIITHSGLGGCVNKDLDMAVKTALVEAKKKAFYEFGGCGYLWNQENTDRIKIALSGNVVAMQNYLVEHSGETTPEGVASFYGVEKKQMADEYVIRDLMMKRGGNYNP